MSSSEPKDRAVPMLSEERLARLRDLIPEAFDAEGGFDVASLQAAIGLENGPVEKRFGLVWPGKQDAIRMASAKPEPGKSIYLFPVPEASIAFSTTRNVFVEGDNLLVAQLLRPAYAGKVRLIYMDPPYNTGKDFIYRDNFTASVEAYDQQTDLSDQEGRRIAARTTAESGRRHSLWLNFMYPRLLLARQMLRADGAIIVACDDNEMAHLRAMMDEIFGAENFVAVMVWQGGRKNDARLVSVGHDYMLIYARDSATLKDRQVEWHVRKDGLEEVYAEAQRIVADVRANHGSDWTLATKRMKAWFSSLPKGHPSREISHYDHLDGHDDRGNVFFPDNLSWPGGGGPTYEVLHPTTGKPVKVPGPGWRISSPDKFAAMVQDDRILFGADETKVPNTKRYLRETETWALGSVLYQDRRSATKRLSDLMDGKVFDYPKDETVLARLIEAMTDDGDIVMDLFAGSGSTGHAVWLQNAKDGKQRRFVLVTLQEAPNPASEAAVKGFRSISQIAQERLRRAGAQVQKDHPSWNGDTGFRSFSLGWTSRTTQKTAPMIPENFIDYMNKIAAEQEEGLDSVADINVWRELLRAGLPLDAHVELKSDDMWHVSSPDRSIWIAMPKKAGDLRQRLQAIGAKRDDEVILIERAVSDSDVANCSAFFRLKTVRL